MDMSYILDSGQNRLYKTFPNIFSLLSANPADLSSAVLESTPPPFERLFQKNKGGEVEYKFLFKKHPKKIGACGRLF